MNKKRETYLPSSAGLDEYQKIAAQSQKPTLRTLFHNLVHVTQFALLGAERFIRGYFKTLHEAELWMVAPSEEQAYQLDLHAKSVGRFLRGKRSAGVHEGRPLLVEVSVETKKAFQMKRK